MNKLILVLMIGLLFSGCLYEKGYIRRIVLTPNYSQVVSKVEPEKSEIPKKTFKKCLYSFVFIGWYDAPFPSSWNDVVADVNSETKTPVRLKNVTIYMDAIDFLPPWTAIMLFLPLPTLPIMRACGVVEGQLVSDSKANLNQTKQVQ